MKSEKFATPKKNIPAAPTIVILQWVTNAQRRETAHSQPQAIAGSGESPHHRRRASQNRHSGFFGAALGIQLVTLTGLPVGERSTRGRITSATPGAPPFFAAASLE